MASNAQTATTVQSDATIHEATADVIDSSTYQPLGELEERYYLVGMARGPTDGPLPPIHTAIYATADGARVTTRRWGPTDQPPHAISAYLATEPLAADRLATDADELARLVARAHPEVSE
jgi:hypothetical protein